MSVGSNTDTQSSSGNLKTLKLFFINYFKIEERGSSLQQEIRAGITTFLTMCYILLVNPQILSEAGIPAQQVVLSTAISAG